MNELEARLSAVVAFFCIIGAVTLIAFVVLTVGGLCDSRALAC